MKNTYILIAGALSLFTALLHTVGGQLSLVDPLLSSTLEDQIKVEWLGAWHMITLMLWYFAYILIRKGMHYEKNDQSVVNLIGVLCILFSIAFIGASIVQMKHAPQYILFVPIGLLCLFGIRKANKPSKN